MLIRRGITLTELLVVITIVAVLTAIAFPVFSHVKERAKQTTCTSNLRQLFTAISLYRSEYDGEGNFGNGSEMGLPRQIGLLRKTHEVENDIFLCKGRSWAPQYQRAVYHQMWEDSPEWAEYASVKRGSAVVMVDLNHNPVNHAIQSAHLTHFGIGLYLDGHIATRRKIGNPFHFSWWD